ncbi:MAG: Cation transport protein ChaC [Rhodanobacteraceae bacterium]|jgi:cation transport protein ChaC|nr:MAG: Cation transport protein ChaC [Rhodanobacteraceae bacterium]
MKSTIPGSTPASHDTTALNRARQDFTGVESVWLFGYGSLIHKVDFPYLERRSATIHGWSRRFWQGSHDHRGTHEHPGRVVTLVPEEGASCAGVAYRVAPATFAQLDHREKNGYLRFAMSLDFGDGQSADGIVYIAMAGNAAWLGPADDAAIARHVAASAGPSGANDEYVFKLAQALRELGAEDAHVLAIEAELRKLKAAD